MKPYPGGGGKKNKTEKEIGGVVGRDLAEWMGGKYGEREK